AWRGARRRGDQRRDAVAAPTARLSPDVRQLAAEAAHRRRGRPWENHPGWVAPAPGMARRTRATHSDPRAQGRAAAVADRIARKVQPELAHLRRSEALLVPEPRSARAARTTGRPDGMAP